MRIVVQRVSFARVSRNEDDATVITDADKTAGHLQQIENIDSIEKPNNLATVLQTDTSYSFGKGLMILLGIETGDNESDVAYLTGKLSRLRIFDDENGVMNLSVMDVQGEMLVVSQFTLHAETKKGNRPSYIRAARPEQAIPLYELFLKELRNITDLTVKSGWFGAMMKVELSNEGPVTIIMDSVLKS